MRYALLLLLMVFAAPAFADDFGARFSEEQPAALEDVPPSIEAIAEELEALEPASGEEDDSEDDADSDDGDDESGDIVLSP